MESLNISVNELSKHGEVFEIDFPLVEDLQLRRLHKAGRILRIQFHRIHLHRLHEEDLHSSSVGLNPIALMISPRSSPDKNSCFLVSKRSKQTLRHLISSCCRLVISLISSKSISA